MVELEERIATRAVIIINNKALLDKRGGGICVNQYALIGGKPDEKETPEQAIIREVKEETGLELKNPVIWKEESNDKTIPGQTWHVYYYLGEIRGNLKLKSDEITDVIYVGKEDLSDIDIAFNHKEILEEFFDKHR